METAIDPMTILILGGFRVGKTSLLKRFCGQQALGSNTYQPTAGINCADFELPLKHNITSNVRLLDIGAELIGNTNNPNLSNTFNRHHILYPLFTPPTSIEGAFIMIDCTSKSSLVESDMWLEFLSKMDKKRVFKILLVHKADLPISSRIISSKNLDKFQQQSENMIDWAYTVSDPYLGDVNFTRNHPRHLFGYRQKAPEDLLNKLLLQIIRKRQANLHSLVQIPMNLQVKSCTCYEIDEIEKLWKKEED